MSPLLALPVVVVLVLVVLAGLLRRVLAWNALQRAPDVIRCAPTDVIVLVGTNDVLGTLSERDARRYVWGKKLPARPSLAFYRSSLGELITRLTAQAHTRVAVCTLPPLGEDLSSVENARVREANEIVRDVAARHAVPVLDVHRVLVDELERRGATRGPRPISGGKLLLPMLLRGAGLPLDRIGRLHGFSLLSDGIHLGETAADRVIPVFLELLGADASRARSRSVARSLG